MSITAFILGASDEIKTLITLFSIEGNVNRIYLLDRNSVSVKDDSTYNSIAVDLNNNLSQKLFSEDNNWFLFLKAGEELFEVEKLNSILVNGTYGGIFLPLMECEQSNTALPYLELRLVKAKNIISFSEFVSSFSLAFTEHEVSYGILRFPIIKRNDYWQDILFSSFLADNYTILSSDGIKYLNKGNLQKSMNFFKKGWKISGELNLLFFWLTAFLRNGGELLKVTNYFTINDHFISSLLRVLFKKNIIFGGLEIIKEIEKKYEFKNKNLLYYWKGKFLLKLGYSQKADSFLRQINPDYFDFSKVLDIRWIIEMVNQKKNRSVKNQIKLLGNSYAWQFVNSFEKNKAIYDFSNMLNKHIFYFKCLYYLKLFIDFDIEFSTNKIHNIIDELRIESRERDLGLLYYFNKNYNKSLHFINEYMCKKNMLKMENCLLQEIRGVIFFRLKKYFAVDSLGKVTSIYTHMIFPKNYLQINQLYQKYC